MSNLKKRLLRAGCLSIAAWCSTSAIAGTVLATLQSVGSGDTITLHAVRPNGQPIGEQVLAGISTFTRTGGTDTQKLVGTSDSSFFAFCVEPFEDASLNANYAYSLGSLASADSSSIAGGLGATKSLQISQMFGQFAPNMAGPMTVMQASALQVAIWEIVSESATNSFSVFNGNTYFTTPASSDFNDVMGLAQNYLNYVSSANGAAPQAQGLQALTINGNQDFLVQVVSTAPEPATWLMMILGFGLVGRAMRRRHRGTETVNAVMVGRRT